MLYLPPTRMEVSIKKLDSSLFDWQTWRQCDFADLAIVCRYYDITSERSINILKKYTYGYCDGENLLCRPKLHNKAIMLYKNGVNFWFHIRNNEFNTIFRLSGERQ